MGDRDTRDQVTATLDGGASMCTVPFTVRMADRVRGWEGSSALSVLFVGTRL